MTDADQIEEKIQRLEDLASMLISQAGELRDAAELLRGVIASEPQ